MVVGRQNKITHFTKMIDNQKVISIIPARGGSKSIPRKNIKPLGGKPLVAYSIEQSLASRYIDRTICSTDDKEIAEIAKSYGAEVPFLRPAELAQDDTPDWPVFFQGLQWLKDNENYIPDIVVHLSPTHPFRTVEMIDKGIILFLERPDADSVRSVFLAPQTPYKMHFITKEGFLKPALTIPGKKETYEWPRQKLPHVYLQGGYFYAARYRTIMEKKSMTGDKILAYIIEPKVIIDLDTLFDWEMAEFFIQKMQKENK